MTEDNTSLPGLVIWSGIATIVFGSTLLFALLKRSDPQIKAESKSSPNEDKKTITEDTESETKKPPKVKIVILYGTETGTADEFANQLVREGEEYGFEMQKIDVEDISEPDSDFYNPDPSSPPRCYIFLMATYGEGEPTTNAIGFIQLLKQKDEEKDTSFLSFMSYVVFGLGNKQYEHYNATGKLTDALLEKLGGNRIMPLSLGDDDDDIESDFEQWKEEKLWPELKQRYAPTDEASSSETNNRNGLKSSVQECTFYIKYLGEGDDVTPDHVPLDKIHAADKHYFSAVDSPIVGHTELLQSSAQSSTLHIEIGTFNKFTYQTADNLGVLPLNSPTKVQSIASKLGYDLNKYFRIFSKADDTPIHYFPTPCTVEEFLSRYCDIQTPPRRSELKHFAHFATDALDQLALQRMSSKEGKDEYKEKIIEAGVGLYDILVKLCPSIELPLERMIQFCPRLHPRYYTISSSSSVNPITVHITAAILRGMKKDGTEFRGLCSNYMKEVAERKIKENRILRVFPRDSTFRLPSDPSKPIIMIGPGTGIAPMRAFLQERQYQKQTQQVHVGPAILYFGCKHRSKDYLYQHELETFQKEGVLTQLHLAFSRDQERKVYVQHLLQENMAETWKMVDENGAYIYICGGIKMGHDVSETLKKIVMKMSARDYEQARQYMDRLHEEGRFIQELWQ